MNDNLRDRILNDNESLTRQGMRVLGLGLRFMDRMPDKVEVSEKKDIAFVGLFGLIDPPRPEAKDAVKRCKNAGIRPIMITGDHPLTALYIAQDLGLPSDRAAAIHSSFHIYLSSITPGLYFNIMLRICLTRINPNHSPKVPLIKTDLCFTDSGSLCNIRPDRI